MTKDELEKATGQELIDARNYCGVDGYYRDYLESVNAEMLKRFNRLAELERENAELKAGRLRWHKVAEGDLPKEDDVYLLYTTKGFLLGHYEQGGSDGKVDFCGEPYSDFTEYPNEEEFMENEVIAWCEIPKYERGIENETSR